MKRKSSLAIRATQAGLCGLAIAVLLSIGEPSILGFVAYFVIGVLVYAAFDWVSMMWQMRKS